MAGAADTSAVDWDALRSTAVDAAHQAYCPYSGLQVGAAAIVDDGLAIFESGAILQYLAEKTGKLLPADTPGKYRVLQWVYWQVGGLGPMAGQAHHFLKYSPQKIEYAMHRFQTEVARLYQVLDTQLGKTEYIAGDYSIADVAAWPWVVRYDWQGQKLECGIHIQADSH